MNELLAKFTQDTFVDTFSCISTAEALFYALEKDTNIKLAADALRKGTISDSEIERFVNDLLSTFKVGETFAGDLPFAALAVTVKDHFGQFANRFLAELNSLHLSELPLSPRIASLVFKSRTVDQQNVTKQFEKPPSQVPWNAFVETSQSLPGKSRLDIRPFAISEAA